MYNFILQIFIFSSLGLIIYLFARAMPRVSDEQLVQAKQNFFDRLMAKLPMAKIDESINAFFTKVLRKIKVLILKLDNFITDRLGKLTKRNGSGNGNVENKT